MATAQSGMATDEPEVDMGALVRRAQGGDEHAFEQLYRHCAGKVHAVCLRMTGDPALAEDCTQETFIRAWDKLGSFRGESAVTTWLHRIAVNEVLSVQRRKGHEARYLEAVGAEPAPAASAARTGGTLDIEAAIRKLPEGARNVFVLCGIHGYQHDEAAEFLGVAPGTCKAQLHRARRLLQARLGL